MPIVKNKEDSLEGIIVKYGKKQQSLIRRVLDDIMALFDDYATQIAFLTAKRRLLNNRYLPKDISSTVDRITTTVNNKTKDVIINGIRRVWNISDGKNDAIEKLAAGRRRPPGGRGSIISASGSHGRNKEIVTAVDAFIKRKDSGLNLSKRVWKLSNTYKKVLNETLIEGLKKGTPADELARVLRKNLRNNDVIKNPGAGVYKSPKKNALRLTRTEINMAYANADYDRWQKVEAIIGIEVKLSNRHPKYDICDSMIGKYPKDFHFTGWHPNCLCIAVPILAPQEIRDALMDYRLGLIDEKPAIPTINKIPSSAIKWMEDNAERVNGWKNTPYWVTNNKKSVGKYFK